MQTFKNIYYTSRNYDCTNIVACVAEVAPNDNCNQLTRRCLQDLSTFGLRVA